MLFEFELHCKMRKNSSAAQDLKLKLGAAAENLQNLEQKRETTTREKSVWKNFTKPHPAAVLLSAEREENFVV